MEDSQGRKDEVKFEITKTDDITAIPVPKRSAPTIAHKPSSSFTSEDIETVVSVESKKTKFYKALADDLKTELENQKSEKEKWKKKHRESLNLSFECAENQPHQGEIHDLKTQHKVQLLKLTEKYEALEQAKKKVDDDRNELMMIKQNNHVLIKALNTEMSQLKERLEKAETQQIEDIQQLKNSYDDLKSEKDVNDKLILELQDQLKHLKDENMNLVENIEEFKLYGKKLKESRRAIKESAEDKIKKLLEEVNKSIAKNKIFEKNKQALDSKIRKLESSTKNKESELKIKDKEIEVLKMKLKASEEKVISMTDERCVLQDQGNLKTEKHKLFSLNKEIVNLKREIVQLKQDNNDLADAVISRENQENIKLKSNQ